MDPGLPFSIDSASKRLSVCEEKEDEEREKRKKREKGEWAEKMTINFFLFFLSSSPFSSLLLTLSPSCLSSFSSLLLFCLSLFKEKKKGEKDIAKRDNREKGKEKRSLSSSSLLAPLSFPFTLFFSFFLFLCSLLLHWRDRRVIP